MTESFHFTLIDGIGVLTLARPPRNTLDHRFFGEFRDFSETHLSKTSLHGLVILGKGKHFSSGADISELKTLLKVTLIPPDFLLENSKAFAVLEAASYPVVAAISGCCLGAGLELALACHYRIASSNAMLAFPEASFGLIPGCGGSVRSSRVLTSGQAIDLILSARNLMASEALAMGLIDAIVDRERLLEDAVLLIKRLNEIRSAEI